MSRGRWASMLVIVALVALGVLPWLLTSDVVKLVADRRDVLLGRYSVGRFSANVAITLASVSFAWLCWSRSQGRGRVAALRAVAVLAGTVLAVVLVDVVARLGREPRYVERWVEIPGAWPGGAVVGVLRSRQPDVSVRIRYADTPPTARSFPVAPEGHPPVDVTLTTDDLGFRNRHRRDAYDVVVIGDSFVEGALVDDEDAWPERLARRSGRSVYNLGMGGSWPAHYLVALAAVGVELDPETVVVMLYEGNDFVRSDRPSPGDEVEIEDAPIVQAVSRALVRVFGPIGADARLAGAGAVSWMPVGLPPGPDARYYVFRPKRLLRLYQTEAEFRQSREWIDTASVLEQIASMCASRGIRLVLAYAPSKPHVVMPLVEGRLPPEQLHAFVSLKTRELPGPAEFAARLRNRLGAQESVVRAFAEEHGVGFVSATEPLRRATAAGRQVYYTYDPHWTPLGHELVAAEIHRYLAEEAP